MTVKQLSSGKYAVYVKLRGPDGKLVRVRRTLPTKSKRVAERFEHETRSAILRGQWNDKPAVKAEPAPTLAIWSDMFVNEYSRAKHLRPSTIGEQLRAFRLYLLPTLGASTRVDTIGTPHFDRVRRAMSAKGLSAKTTNNALAVLSRAVSYYFERQGLAVPHFDSCRAKVTKGVPKVWEPQQYEALVQAAAEIGPRVLAVVLLMGDCGLRTGEVIALEWSHLRWTPTPQLEIQRSHWRGHFGPPKGGGRERWP